MQNCCESFFYFISNAAYRVCKSRTRQDLEIAVRNSTLHHPNAVQSKNVASKRCIVVHKARYVFLLNVIRKTISGYTISRRLVTYLQTLQATSSIVSLHKLARIHIGNSWNKGIPYYNLHTLQKKKNRQRQMK